MIKFTGKYFPIGDQFQVLWLNSTSSCHRIVLTVIQLLNAI